MKKLFLFAFITMFGMYSIQAQEENGSQTTKGNWTFGTDAGISFSSSNSKFEFDGNDSGAENTLNTFIINPSIGYFVIDNLSVGLDLDFISTKSTFQEPGFPEFEQEINSFGIFPNATYFFKNGNLAPFVGAGAGYLSTSSGDQDFEKNSGFAFNINAGLAYFISSSVSVNITLDYINGTLTNKEDDDFKTKSNTFSGAIGFAVYL